jgi:hypothetical protein
MTLRNLVLSAVAFAALVCAPLSSSGQTGGDKAKKTASTTATTKGQPKAGASDQAIADAKSKGLVWVNLDSKIYHKSGSLYGKTKNGQFMTEADAKKMGAREAQSGGKKAATTSTKK